MPTTRELASRKGPGGWSLLRWRQMCRDWRALYLCKRSAGDPETQFLREKLSGHRRDDTFRRWADRAMQKRDDEIKAARDAGKPYKARESGDPQPEDSDYESQGDATTSQPHTIKSHSAGHTHTTQGNAIPSSRGELPRPMMISTEQATVVQDIAQTNGFLTDSVLPMSSPEHQHAQPNVQDSIAHNNLVANTEERPASEQPALASKKPVTKVRKDLNSLNARVVSLEGAKDQSEKIKAQSGQITALQSSISSLEASSREHSEAIKNRVPSIDAHTQGRISQLELDKERLQRDRVNGEADLERRFEARMTQLETTLRGEHQAALAGLQAQHTAEVAALRSDHDQEVVGLTMLISARGQSSNRTAELTALLNARLDSLSRRLGILEGQRGNTPQPTAAPAAAPMANMLG